MQMRIYERFSDEIAARIDLGGGFALEPLGNLDDAPVLDTNPSRVALSAEARISNRNVKCADHLKEPRGGR
jgi:hypothetical protein